MMNSMILTETDKPNTVIPTILWALRVLLLLLASVLKQRQRRALRAAR